MGHHLLLYSPPAANYFFIFNGSYASAYITSLILPLDLQSPKYVLSGSLQKNFADPWPRRMPDKQFLSRNRQVCFSSPGGRNISFSFRRKTVKQPNNIWLKKDALINFPICLTGSEKSRRPLPTSSHVSLKPSSLPSPSSWKSNFLVIVVLIKSTTVPAIYSKIYFCHNCL